MLAALVPFDAIGTGQVALAAGTVGNGSPASCTETALDDALDGGGLVTFNCGPDPHVIAITSQKNITQDTRIEGNNLIKFDGGGNNRIFDVDGAITFEINGLVLRNGMGDWAVELSGRAIVT